MKRIVIMVLALVVTAGVSRMASADDVPKKGKGQGFVKMDTNGDGKLSLEEFTAGKPDQEKAKKRFAKIDTDGDSSITKEEMKAAHANKGGGDKKKKDKN